MRLLIIVFGLTLALGQHAGADEFDTEAQRFLIATNSVEPSIDMMDDMLQTLAPTMVDQIYQGMSQQGKDVGREDVVALVDEYRQELKVRMRSEIIPAMIGEFRKHFSLDEMRELNELAEMPAFKNYAAKLPAIMASSHQTGEALGTRLGAEVMQELIAKNPMFH